MNNKDLINHINKSVEELDFITARKYIEENINYLNENKIYLKGNARELLNFLTKRIDSGIEPLKRSELATINSINISASKFDLRGIKFLIKENAQLLLRKDVMEYLNSDAKALLEGMGIIEKNTI